MVLRANNAVGTLVDVLSIMQGLWEVRVTPRLTQRTRLILRYSFEQALVVAQSGWLSQHCIKVFGFLGVTSMDGFLDDYFPSVAANQAAVNTVGNLYCQYDSQVGFWQALSTLTATAIL